MTSPAISRFSALARSTLACLAVVSSSHQAFGTPTQEERDRAVVHFNEGNEAFRRGDTHQAYRQYRTAWELNQTFDIACNLGRTEAELGKLTQAAEHLTYCLENFSASPQEDLKAARLRYADLFRIVRQQVSMLSFRVEPEGAELFLNGNALGVAPVHADVFVLPGTQVVELRMTGYHELRREVPARAGESRTLELSLAKLGSDANASPPQTAPLDTTASEAPAKAAPAASQTKTWVVLGSSALAVAGGSVGLGYALQSRTLDDEATALRDEIRSAAPGNDNPCASTSIPACATLSDTIDSRDRARTIAAGGFVAMGVFGLGALATWLWWPPAPTGTANSTRSVVMVPVLADTLVGAALSGQL